MKKIALCIVILLVTACSHQLIPLDEQFELSLSKKVTIIDTGLTLTFTDILDSRCTAVCVWEGKAIVTVVASYEDVEETLEFSFNSTTNPAILTVAGYEVALSSVLAGSGQVNGTSNYVIQLKVSEQLSLTGTEWQLEGFGLISDSLLGPVPVMQETVLFGVQYSMLISEENGVSGDLYCNTWFSSISTSPNVIDFGGVSYTEMLCPNNDSAVLEQIELFTQALEKASEYQIVGDRLTIITPDLKTLHFVAQHHELQKQLTVNRANWNDAGISSYQYHYRPICFCFFQYFSVTVQVNNGVVVAAYDENEKPIPAEELYLFHTMEGIFDLLQSAMDSDAASIDASFDSSLGYPISGDIDYLEFAVDDEFGFIVNDFLPFK